MKRHFLFTLLFILGCAANGSAQSKTMHMPVIDCVVDFSHGSYGGYSTLESYDTITLDLNTIDKIALNFKSKRPEQGMIPLNAPFRVEKVSRPDLPQYFQMKLVSSGPERRVTIDILRTGSRSQKASKNYEIIIIAETGDFVDGVAVLKGIARD